MIRQTNMPAYKHIIQRIRNTRVTSPRTQNESPHKGEAHANEQMKAHTRVTHSKWISKRSKAGRKPAQRLGTQTHMMKIAESKNKIQTRARRQTTHREQNKNQDNHNTHTNCQASFPFTHSEESTRPTSTKSGYIISHSDLSKSAAESEPPCNVAATKVHSASIFIFFDFPREALVSAAFCHRGSFAKVTHEQECRADEPPV
jgi:hypothetical protein